MELADAIKNLDPRDRECVVKALRNDMERAKADYLKDWLKIDESTATVLGMLLNEVAS